MSNYNQEEAFSVHIKMKSLSHLKCIRSSAKIYIEPLSARQEICHPVRYRPDRGPVGPITDRH